MEELVDELIAKMDSTNYGVFYIGHNKIRTIKNKIDPEGYNAISSNLSFDYFNAFAYKCPVICNIVSEKKSEDGVLTDKQRFMYFRDDGFVEAGSRFSEMPVQVPYGAEEYYNAVVEGIKASIEKDKGTTSPKSKQKAKDKSKPEPKQETIKYTPDTLVELSKKVAQKSTQDDVMAIYDEFGITNPKIADEEALRGAINKLKEMV